jgi:hypothetical protein
VRPTKFVVQPACWLTAYVGTQSVRGVRLDRQGEGSHHDLVVQETCLLLGMSQRKRRRVDKLRLFIAIAAPSVHASTRRSLRAFPTTDTELKLIAAAAMTGLRRSPKNG